MANGFFITLEGGEGAGKSTQAIELARRIKLLGHRVLTTREPGGSANAEEVRNLLVNGAPDRWTSTAETLLNYAARDSHLNETIRPALKSGQVVICDRFMDSTRAYQGAAGGADLELIAKLEKIVIAQTRPDLTLVFDLEPSVGLARTRSRQQSGEDRFESKPLAFHETLRQAFLELADQERDRCVLIDASQDVDRVSDSIWTQVKPRLAGL